MAHFLNADFEQQLLPEFIMCGKHYMKHNLIRLLKVSICSQLMLDYMV